MRQHYERQRRFDCSPIAEVSLNFECRDEMIPVLAGLQHVEVHDVRGHRRGEEGQGADRRALEHHEDEEDPEVPRAQQRATVPQSPLAQQRENREPVGFTTHLETRGRPDRPAPHR